MATLRQWQLDFIRRFNYGARGFGGRVTSYVRSPEKNRAVGGAPNSQHLYGLAADVVPASGQRNQLTASLRAAGLIVIDEGNHLHIQRLPAGTLAGYLA